VSPRPYIHTVFCIGALCMAQVAAARDVRMLSFSFRLPSSWHIEADGGDRLFATGTKQPDMPPVFMAEVCVSTADKPCPPSVAPDSDAEGSSPRESFCTGAQMTTRQWPNGITEKRWICAKTIVSGAALTSAVTYFEIGDQKLRVGYIAGDKDPAPAEFLDDLAKSLKAE